MNIKFPTFPTIRNVRAHSVSQHLVPVVPMSSPVTMVTYFDTFEREFPLDKRQLDFLIYMHREYKYNDLSNIIYNCKYKISEKVYLNGLRAMFLKEYYEKSNK